MGILTTELPPEDVEAAREQIRKLGKSSRKWRRFRWFGIVTAILFLGLCGLFLWGLRQLGRAPVVISLASREASVTHEEAESMFETAAQRARGEARAFVGLVAFWFLGVMTLAHCLMNWKRHVREALIAKVLRVLLRA